MALAQSILSICLEKCDLDIVAHSLRDEPERRSAGTKFDVEYTKAHRLEVHAIPASEILIINASKADRAQPNCYQQYQPTTH